jgi:hypothetical protein
MNIAATLLPTGQAASLSSAQMAIILAGTFGYSVVIAWIYKGTHRGLSYSQSFQFSLVIIGMLSAAVMMVARVGILNALGILGVFALVRFRTIVKDTKDMAYILFVLVIGLAMGTQEYALAGLTTGAVGVVILVLTRLDFGLSKRHESVIRLVNARPADGPMDTSAYEGVLSRMTESYSLLSAHTHGGRMEITYGIRPRRKTSPLAVLDALNNETDVENAELFDTKHQVEF